MTAVPWRTQWQPEPALTDYWAHSCSQQTYYTPVNHARSSPIIHVPNYMDHYSFTDPEGWVAELTMLADR